MCEILSLLLATEDSFAETHTILFNVEEYSRERERGFCLFFSPPYRSLQRSLVKRSKR